MPSKIDYILIGIGAFSAVLVTSYVPSLMKVMSVSSEKIKDEYASCPRCKEELEFIPGIDTESLRIARERGLI